MEVSGFWLVFGCGLFGGLLGELSKWYRLREKKQLPLYIKSTFYWAITILMLLCSGILTALYGTDHVNPIMAINIGISAPLLIQSMAQNKLSKHPKPYSDETFKNSDSWKRYFQKENTSIIEFLAG